ncbi:AI-2E family transporter [Geitlerinema sp. PCC 9228]|uniref:AI-2E family transporter n=1 Tax=Geitlerinema sp. PCC 9228 TaxID=111611 RepID=UPI00147AE8FE|nr:AI-2E family transporter [Geitlerinema sp. PCC 9228]
MELNNRIPGWLVFLLIFPLIVLNGWVMLVVIDYFQTLITSFIAAALLAFLLNYPVQLLEKYGIRRGYAVLLVFLVVVSLLVTGAILGIPVLAGEFNKLVNRLPSWIESANLQFQAVFNWIDLNTSSFETDVEAWNTAIKSKLKNELQAFLIGLPNFALGTINNLFQIVFIGVLTVFFAIFGPTFLHNLTHALFSSERGDRILDLLGQNFNSYVVNQVTLASAIGLSMIPIFLLLNVPFALLFSLGIGLMGLIPFCAILSIFAVSFLLALKSFWLGIKVLAIALLVDQLIENTVTPRLLGSLTGLNPIVVLFSLMVGVQVAGYLGVLIAVPVAATIKSAIATMKPSPSQVASQPSPILYPASDSWKSGKLENEA